ncbi:MAG: type I methionyl aminopeptidase, partial [Opitutales bacterium]
RVLFRSHGIGSKTRILQDGDIIAVDVCVSLDGHIGDNCRTVPVGSVAPEVDRLLKVTEEAMYSGIAQAVDGKRVGDISHAVQQCIEGAGFAVITNFVGHGVGKSLHEEPQIPNYGKAGSGPRLKRGLTLAIEPMVNMRTKDIHMADDGWTALAVDGMPSAHFEHTVMVDSDKAEILTIPEGAESQRG